MTRYLICIVICIFFAIGLGEQARAVEKKEKQPVAKVKPAEKGKTSFDKVTPDSQASAVQSPKKYDDFIDKNDNGIDDRKEKLVPKAAKKDPQKEDDNKK